MYSSISLSSELFVLAMYVSSSLSSCSLLLGGTAGKRPRDAKKSDKVISVELCVTISPSHRPLTNHYVHVARFGPASGTRPDHASGTDRGDFRRLRPPPPLQLFRHGTLRVHVCK
uniref:(northern house mosquito) hypothetical protein n=1 Tax=Culex pipiens TaxID=7175 RepID=A0A8D8AWE2_CULPI